MTQAFSLAQAIHDAFDVPVFPVVLTRDATTGKWGKAPPRGCKWRTQAGCPGHFDWSRAQGVGVPMGEQSGLCTIDVDSYKPGTAEALERWLATHDFSAARVHRTASGGRHHIFQMPPGATFGNRAPAIDGLDVRGTGGFIVWADVLGLYAVERHAAPGPMPQTLIEELTRLNARTRTDYGEAPEPDWAAFENERVTALGRRIGRMAVDRVRHPGLHRRWSRQNADMKDRSRSALDMAVASCLARAGLTYDEIVVALLRLFAHGVAARDGGTDQTQRQARRAAWRAVSQAVEEREARLEDLKRLARALPKPGVETRFTPLKD